MRQRSNKIQNSILSDLRNIGKSGNLEDIVVAEKVIVQFDLKEYANSASMKSSLSTAREELEAIEVGIGQVTSPRRYKEIDIWIIDKAGERE
ncbi:MAG: hypothetical protein LBD68_05755 [Zoogloeaceae bacterium]|jgi:hypothetical protein|nr:hypothetical protein [Zoogloeaceae bacterium]